MTAAIFGLLGVIVGGVLNGMVASGQARRAESDELRAAARLVSGELVDLHTHIMILEAGDAPTKPPPTPHWDTNQALLARTMDHVGWSEVRNGVQVVLMLERYRHDEALFKTCVGSLERALNALGEPAEYGLGPSPVECIRIVARRLNPLRRRRLKRLAAASAAAAAAAARLEPANS